jgi:hypothetical protein
MPELLLRFDWVLNMVVGTVIVSLIRRELGLRPIAAARPLLIANAPWVLSGIGAFVYPDRSGFSRFDMRLGLLPVALICSVAVIWISLLTWLFRGGADHIAASPRAVRALNLPRSAENIKLAAAVCIGGAILGMIALVISESMKLR